VTNTVASDTFGDNAEGNIGEFLKHLPGVELDLFYGEVRTVRLGGLGSEYTSVTMDGIALASADANNSGSGAARSFTMEMASLNSMESIEVSKTISADVDANAPAGTINLRTKRAFDRAGRRISWQTNVTAHSEEFTFNKTRGPDEDGFSRKIRPGGIFEYSDVFLNRRLGIVLNLSESNVYQETLITSLGYNATPTATDTRPLVITAVNMQHAPRFNKRFATTLSADYKISSELSAGLGVVYNYADLWTPQRTVIFNTGARNTVLGDDPLVSFTTNSTAANVQAQPIAVSKLGETFTLLPKFAYKRGDFELEGRFAYSDSTSWYNPLGRRNSVRDAGAGTAPNTTTANGIQYRAERSSSMSTDWHFTQIAGPDISSGASFTNPAVTTNDGRFSRSVLYSGEMIGTLKTTRWLPVVWKSGIKARHEVRKFEDDQLARRYDYIGAGNATTGAWAAYRSPWDYDLGVSGGSITSSSGGSIFMPNLRAIGDLYRSNPGDFRQNWGTNSDNFYESYVARRRKFDETINAAFFMGTTSLGKFTARAGLRWEETSTDATEADTRTPAEVRAAGFNVNSATGRATTIPGLEYQYLSQPKVHRTGNYDNFFPSASVKYRFNRNFDIHFGYSSTIRRPSYKDLAGVWLINDTNLTVTSPNFNLKPETSENYATRLAYYFEPVGQLAATFTQRSVKDLFVEQRRSAEAFGYTGEDELANYDFVTVYNSPGTIKIRSMEWEYSQSLSFLGEKFKRLSARVSYTRLYAELPRANLTPHLASGGLNYTLGRLNVYGNWNWTDDVTLNVGERRYRRHRANLDAGGSWRLSNRYSLSVSARNLTNTPYIEMRSFGNNPAVMVRDETVGASWTFAVKGTY
jgi:iron complex outermembrane recepter protein